MGATTGEHFYTLADELAEGHGHGRVHLLGRRGVQVGLEHYALALGQDGLDRLTCEHPVHCRAKVEDVRADIEGMPFDLLGSDVVRRSLYAVLDEPHWAALAQVYYLHVATVTDEYVVGLEIMYSKNHDTDLATFHISLNKMDYILLETLLAIVFP